MTLPNPVFEETDILNTRRIHERQLHLSPNPAINRIIEYALAYAARQHEILLYAHASLANHQHTAFHDFLGCHPWFRRDFHSLVTRSTNVYRGTDEAKWSPDRRSPVILYDQEALLDKIAYTIANPCTHDLVETPEDWPGVLTKIEELAGPPRTLLKPEAFYDPEGDLPEVLELRFVKPPSLSDWSDEEYRAEIQRRVEAKCEAAQDARERDGRRVLGKRKVLAQSHTDSPSTPVPTRDRNPMVACSNIALRITVLRWLTSFRNLHRIARLAFENENPGVLFPFGTFLHQRRYGVDCSSVGPPSLA